jgi:hypothetical protein
MDRPVHLSPKNNPQLYLEILHNPRHFAFVKFTVTSNHRYGMGLL